VNLSQDDTMELGPLLQFLDDWLGTDHELSTSLVRFVGVNGLRLRLRLRDAPRRPRFMFLLGETDGEGLFTPKAEG
jgi:hypothetical protein